MALSKKKCPMWLMLCIVIFSQNVGMFSQLATGFYASLRDIVQVFILAFLIIEMLSKGTIIRRLLLAYAFLGGGMLIGMCYHGDFVGVYWILECTIALLFVSVYDGNSIADRFERIMFVICGIYTMLWLVANLVPSVIISQPALVLEKLNLIWHHPAVYEYYLLGTASIRSYAIFREPGVYQIMIVTALIIEVFVKDRFQLKKILLYMLSIIATYSTTGYICMILIACMIVWKYKKSEWKVFRWICLGMCAALLIAPFLLDVIIQKFTAVGVNSHSWLSRLASIVTNIYIWKQSPIMGTGLSYIYENYKVINMNVFNFQAGNIEITDDTNTVLLYFAAFGVFVGVAFLIGLYRTCKKATHGDFVLSVLLLVVMIALFAGEALNSTCYPYVLYFMGMSYVKFEKGALKKNAINNHGVL